jgi:hypothetical protein
MEKLTTEKTAISVAREVVDQVMATAFKYVEDHSPSPEWGYSMRRDYWENSTSRRGVRKARLRLWVHEDKNALGMMPFGFGMDFATLITEIELLFARSLDRRNYRIVKRNKTNFQDHGFDFSIYYEARTYKRKVVL